MRIKVVPVSTMPDAEDRIIRLSKPYVIDWLIPTYKDAGDVEVRGLSIRVSPTVCAKSVMALGTRRWYVHEVEMAGELPRIHPAERKLTVCARSFASRRLKRDTNDLVAEESLGDSVVEDRRDCSAARDSPSSQVDRPNPG